MRWLTLCCLLLHHQQRLSCTFFIVSRCTPITTCPDFRLEFSIQRSKFDFGHVPAGVRQWPSKQVFWCLFARGDETRKIIEQDGQEPKGKATGNVLPAIEDLVRAKMFGRLAIHREKDQASSSIVAKEIDISEVSPWLKLTVWSTYLSGHSLSDVARLGAMPVHGSESLLEVLCESVDRLKDSAHRSK